MRARLSLSGGHGPLYLLDDLCILFAPKNHFEGIGDIVVVRILDHQYDACVVVAIRMAVIQVPKNNPFMFEERAPGTLSGKRLCPRDTTRPQQNQCKA